MPSVRTMPFVPRNGRNNSRTRCALAYDDETRPVNVERLRLFKSPQSWETLVGKRSGTATRGRQRNELHEWREFVQDAEDRALLFWHALSRTWRLSADGAKLISKRLHNAQVSSPSVP